jgi:tellurite methyltransferase
MKLNKSVVFFDTQFQKQTCAEDFVLNPFEILALDYLQGTILDLGCGLGNLSLEAGARGHSVVAIDASPAAIARINADAKLTSVNVEAIQADLSEWSLEDSYDTILLIGILSYFPRERAFELLRNVQEQVRPGGRLVINVLLEGMTYREMFDGDHYYLFAPGELQSCFTGWKILVESQHSFPAPGGTEKKLQTLIVEKPAQSSP